MPGAMKARNGMENPSIKFFHNMKRQIYSISILTINVLKLSKFFIQIWKKGLSHGNVMAMSNSAETV